MTDDELMDMARPLAADGGRWPSDWLSAMRAAASAERETCTKVCEQKLQYFKALAQRLCKHQWVALESKDGTVSKFCPVCTLVKDDI